MANTKVPIELSSTPGIVDNSTATAITIDGTGAATFSGAVTMDGLTVDTSSVGGFKVTNEATSGVRLTAYQGTTNSNVRTAYVDAQEFVVSTGTPTGTAVTERLRIDSAGALTSRVAGGVFETRSDGGGFHYKQLLDVATAGCSFTGQSNRGELAAIRLYQTATGADGGYIRFDTSNSGSTTPTQKMVLDASGNLGIGVTPSAWRTSYPDKAIDLGTHSALYDQFGGSTFLANNFYRANDNSFKYKTTAGATAISLDAGSLSFSNAPSGTSGTTATFTTRMTLDASGMLAVPAWYTNTTALGATAYIATGPQGAIYRSTSSIKYKRDVETIEDIYADALLDVRPVFYRSKSDNDNSAHGFWGIIAEELAEIDPRLVHWQTHVPVEVTDDDGVVTTEMVELDTPEPEGVQYERFVPHLINLAKRQRDQMTAQASAIEALTARLEALEGA